VAGLQAIERLRGWLTAEQSEKQRWVIVSFFYIRWSFKFE
jgi:hypothetical protein